MSELAVLVPSGVQHPLDSSRQLAGVVFDMDGTLYDQRRMRAHMAAELLALPLSRPLAARSVWKGLSAYRRAQETLRTEGWSGSAAVAQVAKAAEATGLTHETMAGIVEEWMGERPLKHLGACRAPGLRTLLSFLARSNVAIGLLSDYPPRAKLRALGIADRFSVVLSASDPEVNAFKPNPRGFLVAAARWGVDPADVLVVGDRPDVDAAGARAAGMACAIVGRRSRSLSSQDGVFGVDSMSELHRVLDNQR